jgi:hypothetical protein
MDFTELKKSVLLGSCFLLEASGENQFSYLSRFLEAAHILWVTISLLHLLSYQGCSFLSIHSLTLIPRLPPFFIFKDTGDYIGPTWIIHDNMPFLRLAN